MYAFEYSKPSGLADARRLAEETSEAKYLAGGMTLIPTLKQRLASPERLIDLGGLADLRGITVGDGAVTIGAMTTHAEAAKDCRSIPALADLAAHIGDPQVRNRGTIGGSVANADPAADYPAALVGLGATVVTDRREIAADDFFIDLFETTLEESEIITAVRFPIPQRAAYVKFPNPASRYAIVGVFVGDGPAGLRVAVTGAGPSVFRQADMEAALQADFAPESLDGIVQPPDGLNSDMHASAEYRAHLTVVMARRAVAKALKNG